MNRILFIGLMLAALLLWVQSARANPLMDVDCYRNPDTIEARDRGSDEAVVIYHNSADECSEMIYGDGHWLVAPNGVEVRVIVSYTPNSPQERMTVTPVDPAYEAVPKFIDVLDGQTSSVLVILKRGELF